MIGSADILNAIRELTNSKQLDRSELHGLLEDGIHAALAKKHGPNVQAEVEIDEDKGNIRIVLLKTVVEEVTDPSREVGVEEARFEDPEFQVGDTMAIVSPTWNSGSSNRASSTPTSRLGSVTSSTTVLSNTMRMLPLSSSISTSAWTFGPCFFARAAWMPSSSSPCNSDRSSCFEFVSSRIAFRMSAEPIITGALYPFQ